MSSYIVSEEQDGIRLDAFLSSELKISRSQVQKLISANMVQVDNTIVNKSGFGLKKEMQVHVELPKEPTTEVLPYEFPLRVLFEDESLLIIDKPAGMVVHPAPGHPADTLVNALKAKYGFLPSLAGAERAGIVHRLDMDTSGLLLVAKTSEALNTLSSLFAHRQIEKGYIALVKGLPSHKLGRIEAPIGRDTAHRQKMALRKSGKPAITEYRVCHSYKHHALLEVKPLTGRTHQIRLHLASIGHPIYADALYGSAEKDLSRQFLHASALSFIHPITQKPLSFCSALPPDLQEILDKGFL